MGRSGVVRPAGSVSKNAFTFLAAAHASLMERRKLNLKAKLKAGYHVIVSSA